MEKEQATSGTTEMQEKDKPMIVAIIEKYLPDLIELRKRLFFTVFVLAGLFLACFFAMGMVIPFIIQHSPAKDITLNTFAPFDGIGVYMQFAGMFTLILGLPFILIQIWKFVAPALEKSERRTALRYIPFASFCLIVGFVFAYFVVFPTAFYFSNSVTLGLGLKPMYGVNEFFRYMGNILLAISLLFELPVVVMFLTAIRVLSPAILRKIRKVAYVVLTVIATMITPPDVVSDLLVLVPLLLLFESSIWLSARVERQIKVREAKRGEEIEN